MIIQALSQIACTVMTVYVTCKQTLLHIHTNLCMLLIPLCNNYFSLPMCSSFFCPVLGCLLLSFIVLSCLLPCCTVLIFLHVCFSRSQFCSPAINQTSLSQSKGWFPLLPARTMNCENCQLLATGAINLAQLRTSYCLPTHRPLCFKKIKTTTTKVFLISKTVVSNLYSHRATYNPQSFAPLS